MSEKNLVIMVDASEWIEELEATISSPPDFFNGVYVEPEMLLYDAVVMNLAIQSDVDFLTTDTLDYLLSYADSVPGLPPVDNDAVEQAIHWAHEAIAVPSPHIECVTEAMATAEDVDLGSWIRTHRVAKNRFVIEVGDEESTVGHCYARKEPILQRDRPLEDSWLVGGNK